MSTILEQPNIISTPAEQPAHVLDADESTQRTSHEAGAMGYSAYGPEPGNDPIVKPPEVPEGPGGSEGPGGLPNGGSGWNEIRQPVPVVRRPMPNKYRVAPVRRSSERVQSSLIGTPENPHIVTSNVPGDRAPGRMKKAALAAGLAVGLAAGALASPAEFPAHKTVVPAEAKPLAPEPADKEFSALPGGVKLEDPSIPTSDGNFGEPNPAPNEK